MLICSLSTLLVCCYFNACQTARFTHLELGLVKSPDRSSPRVPNVYCCGAELCKEAPKSVSTRKTGDTRRHREPQRSKKKYPDQGPHHALGPGRCLLTCVCLFCCSSSHLTWNTTGQQKYMALHASSQTVLLPESWMYSDRWTHKTRTNKPQREKKVKEKSWSFWWCNCLFSLWTSERSIHSYSEWGKATETGGLLLDPLNKRFMHYISILRQLGWSFFSSFMASLKTSGNKAIKE